MDVSNMRSWKEVLLWIPIIGYLLWVLSTKFSDVLYDKSYDVLWQAYQGGMIAIIVILIMKL